MVDAHCSTDQVVAAVLCDGQNISGGLFAFQARERSWIGQSACFLEQNSQKGQASCWRWVLLILLGLHASGDDSTSFLQQGARSIPNVSLDDFREDLLYFSRSPGSAHQPKKGTRDAVLPLPALLQRFPLNLQYKYIAFQYIALEYIASFFYSTFHLD